MNDRQHLEQSSRASDLHSTLKCCSTSRPKGMLYMMRNRMSFNRLAHLQQKTSWS